VQVLEHVVRNAQDACSDGGGVTISVERDDQHGRIRIADTGSGMDPAFIEERLFRPFDSTKGTKGMGIGAYQVREYVRMMGGRVEVKSTLGEGTTFDILLPLAAERLPETTTSPEATGEAVDLPLPDPAGNVTKARVSMGME
jgi:signal transduction histidine kinase